MTVHGVELTKPDKVLFPGDGITKLDLATYYDEIAGVMLPHLRGRPINMQRFPDGIDGMAFYEKKLPSHFPDWIGRVRVATSDGPQDQVTIKDARTLVYLAQQACITPHAWLSREDELGRPDQLIIDLDPNADDPDVLAKVRRATRLTGELLDDLGLTSFVKTTGSRGYHVMVPLRRTESFDEVRAFAHRLGERLADAEPDLLTVEHRKAKRGDRVFVDVLRNGYGQTAVPPYAVRARPGAPVATPIEWTELSRVAPDGHDIRSVRRRLKRRACPWADVRRHLQGLARARERLRRLG